ncbi:hypothetical protein EWF20_10255 [Sulfolobus sp. S-194]|uniref:hypothetical protein n=1 Tax=Sulfolobus sp. S-194 TaxID=2512240 RepID=UPI0014372EDF|nr:hypothetical protein [Sulfolobus sp. S-194]QIW24493.1 hypothetical protein EWF20_10255 [Sulfolobus sp. S-194]
MPNLVIDNGKIIDNDCIYEIKNDKMIIFLDFERIFDGMSKELKDKILREINHQEHCDAISISYDNTAQDQITIKIYELSMEKNRDITKYIRKFEYCAKFSEYFLNNISKLVNKKSKIHFTLIFVVNSDIVEKVEKEIKKLSSHFNRPIFIRYGKPKLDVKVCKAS